MHRYITTAVRGKQVLRNDRQLRGVSVRLLGAFRRPPSAERREHRALPAGLHLRLFPRRSEDDFEVFALTFAPRTCISKLGSCCDTMVGLSSRW